MRAAAVLSASGAALLPARAVVAQPAPADAVAPAAGDASANPRALVQRDVDRLTADLTRAAPATRPAAEAAIQQQRDEAARRLLSRASAPTRDVLINTLQNPAAQHDAKLAICRAVADDPQPDPRFAAALLPLLGGERALSDAAASALGRFGYLPNVRQQLIAFAQNVRQGALRIAAIRALGTMVSRDVADALIALMAEPVQGTVIQNAAADAMVEMTGLLGNGHDVARWQQWHQANVNKPDVVWRADVLATRDARMARDAREQSGFARELQAIVNEQYQRADRDAKFALVMRFLNSPDARARQVGIQFVRDAHSSAAPFPLEAPRRLQELLGDADPEVRLAAAAAVRDLNRSDAIDAVLTQLAQEPNNDVKVALVNALIPMGKVQAVPALRELLRDPSIKVATTAATGLGALGPIIARDPRLAGEIANELWQLAKQRAGEPGGAEFRAAAIEAVGTLKDRTLAKPLLLLLNGGESDRVRAAALRALGALGERDASSWIADWLNQEQVPAVRVAAVDALGSTAIFEDAAPTLLRYMSPNQEPDEAVRQRAWIVYQSKLPAARNIDVLTQQADKFRGDPGREVVVLQALNERLQKEALDQSLPRADRDARLMNLALFRQTTGELQLQLGSPDKAALLFRDALDYWQDRGAANQQTVRLVQQLMDALLASRQYDKATKFAAKQIASDRTQQGEMGPRIRDAAERLMNEGTQNKDAQKLNDALTLIKLATAMDPPLDERFQRPLREFRQQIEQRMGGKL